MNYLQKSLIDISTNHCTKKNHETPHPSQLFEARNPYTQRGNDMVKAGGKVHLIKKDNREEEIF